MQDGWRRVDGLKGASFVELFSGHDVGELGAPGLAGVVTGGESPGIPGVGGDVIEGNAFALLVEIGETGFCARETTLRGEANESGGFGVVALDSDAVEIKIGEIVLRVGET